MFLEDTFNSENISGVSVGGDKNSTRQVKTTLWSLL